MPARPWIPPRCRGRLGTSGALSRPREGSDASGRVASGESPFCRYADRFAGTTPQVNWAAIQPPDATSPISKQEVPLRHGQHLGGRAGEQFAVGADLVGLRIDLDLG